VTERDIKGAGLDARPSYLLSFVLCLEAEADMEHSRGTAAEPDATDGSKLGLAMYTRPVFTRGATA